MHSDPHTHKLHTYLFLHIPHRAHSWSFDHKCQITKSFTNFQTFCARQSIYKDGGIRQATMDFHGPSLVHFADVMLLDNTDSRSTHTAFVVCQFLTFLLYSGDGGSVLFVSSLFCLFCSFAVMLSASFLCFQFSFPCFSSKFNLHCTALSTRGLHRSVVQGV